MKARFIKSRYLSISQSAKSFAFFATPHRGGLGAEYGQIIAGLVRRLCMRPRTGILEALRKDSHVAPDINDDFLDGQDNYHVCTFYECQPMMPPGAIVSLTCSQTDQSNSLQIVERDSAILGLGSSEIRVPRINADHSSICKFSAEDEEYRSVIDEIEVLVSWAIKSAGSLSESGNTLSSSNCHDDRLISESGPSPIGQNFPQSFTTQNEILIHSSTAIAPEPSKLNRQPRKGPFFLVPYFENSNFVGQEIFLDHLLRFSNLSNEPAARFVLYGLGGVGKTQIVLAHAYQYRQRYPEHSIFWIHASDIDQLHESLRGIAAHCRISRIDDTTEIMLERVRRWLSEKSNGHWLVVIDNADNADIFSKSPRNSQLSESKSVQIPSAAGLDHYVPACAHGKIIITTNNKAAGEILARHIIEVRPMNQHHSSTLLRKHLVLRDTGISYDHKLWHDHDLEQLADHLDHLPLALVQAAAFIRINSMSVKEYLELVFKDESSLPGVLDPDIQAHDGPDPSKPLLSTLNVAFDQIQDQCGPAADLLSLMSFYDAQRIPKLFLMNFHSNEAEFTSRSLDTLLAYSVITSDPKSETFSVHHLVQLAMRQRLSALNAKKKWVSEALCLLSKHFPNGEFESWSSCAALIPHALSVLKNDLYGPAEAIALGILQSKISWYYLQRGLYWHAEMWSHHALENMISAPGVKQTDILNIKSNRVVVLQKLSNFEKAEDLAQEVWEGHMSILGAKHKDTLRSLARLCLIYQQQGRYFEGEAAIRKIIKSLERTLEAGDIQILASKIRLALILQLLGRYAEAEEYAHAVIEGYEKNFGLRHPDTLKARWCLGLIYYSSGKYAEAERLEMKTWKLQTEVLGPDHPDTLKSQHGLSNDLQAQLKFAEAEPHKREVYRKSIMLVSARHVYTFIAGSSLASCLVASTRYARHPAPERLAEAEGLYRTSLLGREQTLSIDHPDTLTTKTDLATVQRLRGRVPSTELEASERDTLKKLKNIFPKDHAYTIKSRDNLARILWAQRFDSAKRKDALKKARDVFAVVEKRLGWSDEQVWLAAELLCEILPAEREKGELEGKMAAWAEVRPRCDEVVVEAAESQGAKKFFS